MKFGELYVVPNSAHAFQVRQNYIVVPIIYSHESYMNGCVSGMHCVKSVQIRSFCCSCDLLFSTEDRKNFSWSVFARIRTEYGDIRSNCPYSVRIRENADQKKLRILDTFHAVMGDRKDPKIFLYRLEVLKVKLLIHSKISYASYFDFTLYFFSV